MKVGTKFNCGSCGIEVIFDGNGTKFCSRECYLDDKRLVRETRTCRTCGEEKKLTEENFAKHKGFFMHRCKDCQKNYTDVYWKKHLKTKKYKETIENYKKKSFGLTPKQKYHIKKTFGVTLEQYGEMFTRQNGVCAICKNECKTHTRLTVDHDHETDKVRGLLCFRCNTSLEWTEKHLDGYTRYINKNKGE